MTVDRRSAEVTKKQEEIVQVVTRYEAAFNQNDAEAMNALFSPDTVFVNFSGTLVFGAERLYQAQSSVFSEGGPLEKVTVRYLVESIVFLTPDVAVAHTRQRSTTADGRIVVSERDPMEGILTMTLMRNGAGDWRIRAAQNTPVAAP
ncbi:YybH family protein [Streptomyces violens]|uniref:YybH family protein n=1 Tax=Streptomyces violens TaxID=66377 RepID=UPI00068D71C9|nr:SgcJ/EcaC family oxidoreductase [Streptomyces violens]